MESANDRLLFLCRNWGQCDVRNRFGQRWNMMKHVVNALPGIIAWDKKAIPKAAYKRSLRIFLLTAEQF